MNKAEMITAALDQIRTDEGDGFVADEVKINSVVEEHSMAKTGIAIKILSVFGGVIASLIFLAFLFLAGLYESETGMLVLGIIFTGVSVMVNKLVSNIMIESVTVSFYIVGFCMLGFGLGSQRVSVELICVSMMGASLLSMAINQSYLLSFLAVLIFNGSVITMLLQNHAINLFHIFNAIQVVIVVLCFLNEAAIIRVSTIVSKLYNPVRTGMMVSMLATLHLPAVGSVFGYQQVNTSWLVSIVIIASAIYLSFKLSKVFGIRDLDDKLMLYAIGAVMFIPHIFSPAIPGAILVILVNFYVKHRGAVALGLIYFLYVLSRYYYELQFSLLTKSGWLFGGGLLFIVVYLIISKKFKTGEKV